MLQGWEVQEKAESSQIILVFIRQVNVVVQLVNDEDAKVVCVVYDEQ